MNGITQFEFKGNAMSIFTDDDGELLFPVTPLEIVLGAHLSRHVRQSKVYERGMDYRVFTRSSGRLRNFEFPSRANAATFLTESGLYKAVLRSNAPEARAFQNKVTREVLPSIRIHGCYPPPSEPVTAKYPENRALIESARKSIDSAYATGALSRVHAGRGYVELAKLAAQYLGLDFAFMHALAAPDHPVQLHLIVPGDVS